MGCCLALNSTCQKIIVIALLRPGCGQHQLRMFCHFYRAPSFAIAYRWKHSSILAYIQNSPAIGKAGRKGTTASSTHRTNKQTGVCFGGPTISSFAAWRPVVVGGSVLGKSPHCPSLKQCIYCNSRIYLNPNVQIAANVAGPRLLWSLTAKNRISETREKRATKNGLNTNMTETRCQDNEGGWT